MDKHLAHLPSALYQAGQVRELDRIAIEEAGIPGYTLMERAGTAAFRCLQHFWPRADRVLIVCGVGNNAGDGYVLARLAKQAGLKVAVYQVGNSDNIQGEAREALDDMLQHKIELLPISRFEDHASVIQGGVVIDALLGTGLQGDVREEFAAAIHAINQSRMPVLAMDIPSGLDADSGRVLGQAVRAHTSICFLGLKQGMFTLEGPQHSGEVVFDDLQVPADVITRVRPAAARLTLAALARHLADRPANCHKGQFGHVLVIAGDHGYAGAARMAAEAAARVGAGLVSVATRPEHVAVISGPRPELMVHGIESAADCRGLLKRLLNKATVVVLGPGLGQSEWSRMLLTAALDASLPMVMDADALNLLAKDPVHRDDWILTPHPGEAGRLLGSSSADIQRDRFTAVRALQQQFGGIAILKGNGSLVCAEDGLVGVCPDGNPGMASGGMGDVLSGVIAGLLAQLLAQQPAGEDLQNRGRRLMIAARLGLCVHGEAADVAAQDGQRGMLASDVLACLRDRVNPSRA